MASDHQVRSGINIALCQCPLILLRFFFPFNAPVDQNHHLVSCCVTLRNLRKQRLYGNLIGGQHARMTIRGRPVCLRDHPGCPDEGHPLSVFLKHHRLFRFIQILSGTGMQNTGAVQDLTGI